MAIEERIGFQVADAVTNLLTLNSAIQQVNASIGTLNRTANGTRGVVNVANAFQTTATNATNARNAVAGATNSMRTAGQVGTQAGQSLTLSWQTFARVVTTQLIVRGINAVIQALGEASRQAADFEIATARIANITQEGAAGVDGLRDSFRELAIETGRSLDEVTGAGLEALQNNLGNTQETFELLSGAADDLAKATGVDLTSSVNSLSSVLKSFNLDASQARDVADALFVAYDKGRVSLDELESKLGTITPQMNTLGIAFSDGAAAVASLTLSGLNSSTAMTQLRNIMAKLIKPTDDLKAAFERLGVESGQELIERFGGLQGALNALRGAFNGNEQAVAKAFGTIRGQLGILNLLANEGTNLNGVLGAMEGRMGRVAEAAENVNNTTTQKINEEFAKLNDRMIPVGDALNTLKLQSLEFINNFISGFQQLQQREDFQKLTELAVNFGNAFITVIDDIIAGLDRLLRGLGSAAASIADIISRITNPVGTTEGDRINQIRTDMQRLAQESANAAQRIREEFSKGPDTSILGDQQAAFDALRNLEQQARITIANINAQFLANEARIRANTEAFNGFRRSLEAATAPTLFGDPAAAAAVREQLLGISNALQSIIDRSAGADATTQTQLQKELELQQQKVQKKAEELGIDNKAIQALIGQARATAQVLANQEGKAENEEKLSAAALLANEALQRQKQIAAEAGVSLEQLGLAGDGARQAIENIPNPQVDASAAIAQMNALRAAAIAAAQAVAAANSGGGGQYHGGVVHRADGGSLRRGADTVPTLLSPGEFVLNRRSTGRFFSQLQAMNAGQAPSFRESGGPVTNIGDINVNVSAGAGGENPTQTAREIAIGIRREIRRGTSRLS